MICPRCHGLMVPLTLVDVEASASCVSAGWRCLLCGEILDSVIVANRNGPLEPMLGRRARPHGDMVAVSCAPTRKETGD